MARRRPSRPSRRRQRSSSPIWLPLLAIVTCIGLIGAGAVFVILKSPRQSYDRVTLCEDGTADGVTLVLLDLTDPLSATQASRLRTMLDKEIDESPVDTMVSIGVVSDEPEKWGTRFGRCKPPTGEAANTLYENPRLIAERYAREFRSPLDETLREMIRANESEASPIMEALQSLIAATPDFATTTGDRKLIIVSDMLQHSAVLSVYRGQGWSYFEKSGAAARLAGNLSGADIEIIRIPRQTKADPKLTDEFWVRYFDLQGANLPRLHTLGDL